MDWLRLWHDMPNDPKWETIARKSGEPISLVIAMYVHMLVDASRNVTRGHVTVTAEDLASALNVTDDQISAVFSAMEGRVIQDGQLLGWEKRQPKREDSGNPETGAKSAAQRKAEQRERERLARLSAQTPPSVTPGHDASRSVTTDEIRLDKSREEIGGGCVTPTAPVDNSAPPPFSEEFREVLKTRPELDPATVWANFWQHYPREKRTLARWSKWVKEERISATSTPTTTNDPDTKANVEAMAASKGMQPWDGAERWADYKARVRSAPMTAHQPQSRNKWMEKTGAKGSAHAA